MQAKETAKVGMLHSVFAKCLGIVVVTSVVLVTAMSVNFYRKAVDITTAVVFDMAVANTTAAAADIASLIATDRDNQAGTVIEGLKTQSNGLAEWAIVIDSRGNPLFQSTGLSPEDQAALQRLAADTLRAGQPTLLPDSLDIGIPLRSSAGTEIGALAVDWSSANLMADIRAETMVMTAIALALLSISLVAAIFPLRYYLATPLEALQASVRRVSDGDYSTEVTGRDRRDEIGKLAQSLEVMRVNLVEGKAISDEAAAQERDQARLIEILRHAFSALVKGDLTADVAESVAPEFEDLIDDYNAATRAVHDAIAQIVAFAEKIRRDSADLGSFANDLSGRTENQAATLEETAAALDALTSGVRNAADSTREVEGIVQMARTEAKQSGEVVQKTISAMSEISESSNQISAIIAVIDDIAFQTNLLALNAGVEAARAGEAGRGFAVVASEVRALAQRSSEAAHEIKTLISGSSEHVANGVTLVAQAGDALKAITERVVQIATLMSDMANNAQEQAASLDEINVGVSQLDQVTQRNAAMVEESTNATKSLESQSQALSSLVARFTVKPAGADTPLRLDQRVA